MNCDHIIDFERYYEHGLHATQEEIEVIDALNEHIPNVVIDAHTHSGAAEHFNEDNMSDFVKGHMVSTFPVTTLEKSTEISDLTFPGVSVHKLRFAHAFHGIAHKAVNSYLVDGTGPADRVALFGIHGSKMGVDYTVEELRSGKYTGLKMYYSAGEQPVYDLYDYYPKPILAQAEKSEVPIILHLPNSLVLSMDEIKDVATNFPKLRIVLAHAGVTWTDYDDAEPVFADTADYQNIFADTAGVTDTRVLEKIIRQFGDKRILFGSDEPLNLLREQTYIHPDFGPRIITDFPYHWVDKAEHEDFKDTVETPTYNHILQLEALLTAIRRVTTNPALQQQATERIFYQNAREIFDFA